MYVLSFTKRLGIKFFPLSVAATKDHTDSPSCDWGFKTHPYNDQTLMPSLN